MNLRTGVDLIEIERVRAAIDRHGARFLQRVYTPGELACCGNRLESLAARFAAKEAVAKALGTGIWRCGVNWSDIEVLKDATSGAPVLSMGGAAAKIAHELGIAVWSISLSHDRTHAIATVVGLSR
ncbi:MAG: holo-ACP synthase [Caldilineaceae bacterium]|nr:holo-ACP synthase [Caldilineaceae bacterium]